MEHVQNIGEIIVNGRYCYQSKLKNTYVEFTATTEPVLKKPSNKLLQHFTLTAVDDQGEPILITLLASRPADKTLGVERFVIVKCVNCFEILCTPHVDAPIFK